MIADEITIECGPMRLEPRNAPEVELLLGVVADLRIVVRGQTWFSEPDFPVVELSQAIARWLAVGGDSEFETMEAEEVPFLWVRAAANGCVLGAAWENFSIEPPLPCEVVRGTLRRFAENVASATKEQLDVNVANLIGLRAGQLGAAAAMNGSLPRVRR